MKNLNVFVERIGKSKNNSSEVNLTVVWESGAIWKKVKLDENHLTKILLQKSSNAKLSMIRKVLGEQVI